MHLALGVVPEGFSANHREIQGGNKSDCRPDNEEVFGAKEKARWS
jgi:hypothetical protein